MISRGCVIERDHLKHGLVNHSSLSCTRTDMADFTQPQHEYAGTGESWNIGTSVRRSSRSAFGRSTGNDVSGHYKRHYFLSFFPFLLRRLLFS